jgi:hypothetical protein
MKVYRVDLGLTVDIEAENEDDAGEKALAECSSFYSAQVLEVNELDDEDLCPSNGNQTFSDI